METVSAAFYAACVGFLLRDGKPQEPTQHRIPIPEQLMKSMVVLAWVFGWSSWACATLIAFYGGGRVGEILQAFGEDLILPSDLMEGGFSPIFFEASEIQVHAQATSKSAAYAL